MQKYLFEMIMQKMSKEKVIIQYTEKSVYMCEEFRVNMNDETQVEVTEGNMMCVSHNHVRCS